MIILRECLILSLLFLSNDSLLGQESSYFTSALQVDNAHTVLISTEEKDEVIYTVGIRDYEIGTEVMFLVTHNLKGEQLLYKEFDNTLTSKGMRTSEQMLIAEDEIILVYNRGQFDLNSGVLTITSIDLEGELNWTKQYTQTGTREALEMSIDDDGNLYIAGWEQITNPSVMSARGFIQKRDESGELLWHRTYAESEFNETLFNAVKIINEQLYIGGVFQEVDINGGKFDNYLVITDLDGNKTDSIIWGTPENDSSTTPFIFENELYISTTRDDFGEFTHYTIWKIDSANQLVSQTEIELEMTILWGVGAPYAQNEQALFARANKWVENIGFVERIAKFDGSLDTLWIEDLAVGDLTNPISRDLNLLSDGSLLLTGFNFADEGDTQMGWLIKMDTLAQTCSYLGCDSTALDTTTYSGYLDGFFEETYFLQTNPNPIRSGRTTLTYALPQEHPFAWWYIYNANGQMISSRKLDTSQNSREVELGNLPSGLYVWDLRIGNRNVSSGKLQVLE